MYDEYGCDFDWTPEPRKMITAVLPHPGHGRLVEKVDDDGQQCHLL